MERFTSETHIWYQTKLVAIAARADGPYQWAFVFVLASYKLYFHDPPAEMFHESDFGFLFSGQSHLQIVSRQ